MTSDAGTDWAALGRAVKARREALRLPQDLARHGGPSDLTVRKIEHGEVRALQNRTKTSLESALRWEFGTVDQVLSGIDELEPPALITAEDVRAAERMWSRLNVLAPDDQDRAAFVADYLNRRGER